MTQTTDIISNDISADMPSNSITHLCKTVIGYDKFKKGVGYIKRFSQYIY